MLLRRTDERTKTARHQYAEIQSEGKRRRPERVIRDWRLTVVVVEEATERGKWNGDADGGGGWMRRGLDGEATRQWEGKGRASSKTTNKKNARRRTREWAPIGRESKPR